MNVHEDRGAFLIVTATTVAPGARPVALEDLASVLSLDPANTVRVVGSSQRPDALAVTMPSANAKLLQKAFEGRLEVVEDAPVNLEDDPII